MAGMSGRRQGRMKSIVKRIWWERVLLWVETGNADPSCPDTSLQSFPQTDVHGLRKERFDLQTNVYGLRNASDDSQTGPRETAETSIPVLEKITSGERYAFRKPEPSCEDPRQGQRSSLSAAGKNGNSGKFYLNITNPGTNRCLPDGEYRLVFFMGDKRVPLHWNMSGEDAVSLRRRFRYDRGRDALIVTFEIREESVRICLRTKKGKRSLKEQVRTAVTHGAVRMLYREERLRKKKEQCRKNGSRIRENGTKPEYDGTILFLSEQSGTPGANLTVLRDRLLERGLAGDGGRFEITESYRSRGSGWKSLPGVVKKLARADYIFVDDHVPFLDYLVLDPQAVLVQLWHAGVGFKSSGYSRWGHPGCPAPFSCHRQYTFGVTGSKAVIPIFSEIWGINEDRILPAGIPRIDRFLDPVHREKAVQEITGRYPVIGDANAKQVILFAPTYRGRGKLDAGYPYDRIDFEKLYDALGEDRVILFRMHPWVKEKVPIPEHMKDRMADAGDWPDINDLFYVTDVLVTDYSSNICEFSLLDRPMLFYAFDQKEYAKERGFHRSYEKYAPGKVCSTFDELLKAISSGDYEMWKAERYVREQFDHRDCGACDRLIDRILMGKSDPEKTERR